MVVLVNFFVFVPFLSRTWTADNDEMVSSYKINILNRTNLGSLNPCNPLEFPLRFGYIFALYFVNLQWFM